MNSQNFDSKYLENGDRYEVGPSGALTCIGLKGFRLAPSPLTFDDLEGSKIKVILFDVKYINNGNSYDVGHSGDYIYFPWASLCMTLKGYKSMSRSFRSKYL